MQIRRIAAALVTTCVAFALSAAPASAHNRSNDDHPGNRSLAAVLTSDGNRFDHNSNDYDILTEAVLVVLAAKPSSAVGVLAGRLASLEPVDWVEPPATVRAAVLAASADQPPVPRPRRWLLVAAAAVAAGVVVGVLGGRMLWPATVQPAPEVVLATTRLDTLDTRVQEGTATLVQAAGGVELRVATSPVSAGSGYVEVWLINTDGKRMVSVGVLSNGTSGTFPVARGLIDAGYLIVDISREGLDDKPRHSGDSVVRGKLSL